MMLYFYIGRIQTYFSQTIYLHFKKRLFQPEEPPVDDIEFDVFVSYSESDYYWVVEELARRLEPTYRLCLHDRDFGPGTYISTNISLSIEKSRRMIIVMSQGYHNSPWCLQEFQEAHLKCQHQSNYIIMILKDNLEHIKLNKEVQSYIGTHTYVRGSDKWLWEKVQHALPEHPLHHYRQQPAAARPPRDELIGYQPEINRG
jgi:hypothetical protein